ncbi:MAG: hypothetical protein R3A13_11550 [Bdellovibrionota bacterium]
MLSEKKRIILTPNPEKWLNKAREIFPVDEVPITSTIVVKSRTLKFKHNDPADRFIGSHCTKL